ncbi:hypothetical protein NV379_02280 [Paenibacillus sp. N1-5-1-14]|uniref:hypothetical protein n=1 Tax=Paenibacillus radicibacter TaxID=2972488 RepID=UPI00215998D3|nr:hypothetical protein [Paenibacillus radicibacter]MCR8641474.1 hypothetical protein [Paenibacillus radicibacter]
MKKFLFESTNFESKESFHDRLDELAEAYETIPEDVADAYDQLTEYEMWEIIRKMAVEGKRRTANRN